MKVVSAKQMQELDQCTIHNHNIPALQLMENAGQEVSRIIRDYYPDLKKVVIFCGKGNNGGDGLVCARILSQHEIETIVYLCAKTSELKGECRINYEVCQSLESKPVIHEITEESQLKDVQTELANADLVVDALLETGTKGPLQGLLSKVIHIINEADKQTVAIDIPTGMNPDTGEIVDDCIQPAITVTLGLPKIGLVTYPGAQYTGKVITADIGIPSNAIDSLKINLNYLTVEECSLLLPEREPESHKGTYGHVLILAGSPGFLGAACLATESALRSGAGLVTLGVPSSLQTPAAIKLTEAMTLGLPETAKHTLDLNAEPIIDNFLKRANVLAMGPGISTQENTLSLVRRLVQNSPIQVILDADALVAYHNNLSGFKAAQKPVIITPHPGEMARLCNCSIQDVQNNRISLSRRFAKDFGVYLVLKGAATLIAEPSGQVYINSTGNPGMATGGAGDVLTGIIASLSAQGLTPLEACLLGSYLHGLSGDFAAGVLTQYCLTARDIIQYLPKAFSHLLSVSNT